MKEKQAKQPVKKKSKKQDAIAKAKAFAKLKRTSSVGSVQNAHPDFRYYYWDADGVSDGRQRKLRETLELKGYEQCDGTEYVVGCRAEVWRIPKEAYDVHFADRMRRNEQRRNRLEHAKNEQKRRQSLNALEEAITQSDPEVIERLKGLLS